MPSYNLIIGLQLMRKKLATEKNAGKTHKNAFLTDVHFSVNNIKNASGSCICTVL